MDLWPHEVSFMKTRLEGNGKKRKIYLQIWVQKMAETMRFELMDPVTDRTLSKGVV
jgi:hypothetical protein